MKIDGLHLDALTEIFNVGAGRAAASLSEIVGEEVKLSVPEVKFYHRNDISAGTLSLTGARVGAVRQRFSGQLNLDASLMFREERALEIVQDMLHSQMGLEDLVEFEQEAMCELGNIIMNGCMAAISDLLAIPFASTLPEYLVDDAGAVLKTLASSSSQPVILVLHMDLTIEKRAIHGYLVFLLSSDSLNELLDALNRFLDRI
ncbi:chemotaxis protein CheC [Variovorax sp. HJSM1_2]|uniref:chemotaxis protein CheC n=1 Tax=Variovorax sp. HJSM1_2 TaxID=3366263 RepID=UPI003BC7446A